MSDIMSPQVDQLFTALAKAQGEMLTAGKSKDNPFFKSKYADLESVVNASRVALAKNGLSVTQVPKIIIETGQSFLVTILGHSSGQWIQSTALHNPPKTDVQSLASYNTYLRRMCYASIVGVVTGDDDDGEAAMQRNSEPCITGYQHEVLIGLIHKMPADKKELVDAWAEKIDLKNLPASKYAETKKLLESRLTKE